MALRANLRLAALGALLVLGPPAPAQAQDALRLAVRGFEIEGELPMPREAALALLAPFAGEAVGLEQLQGAARALEAALAERGHAFHRVILPPQAVAGTVRLRVLAFRLARVAVSGNGHFSSENILASLPALAPGAPPDVAEVARERAAANEHPAKRVEIVFRPSATPDAVDAQVAVQDEAPRRFSLGASNTGEPRTGRWRASLGYQHANLWGRDHTLIASYTTSPGHEADVKQYGFHYGMPFYAVSGALTLSYAFSDANSGTVADAFQVSGRGEFAGLRWRQHLTPAGALSHALEAGVEDRFFDNNVIFGTRQIGVDVRSRPVTLAYQARYDQPASTRGGRLEYVRNLPGGAENTDAAYAGNRAGAGRRWQAWRYGLDGSWSVGAWLLGARLRGQATADALIPGEQFGLGGAQSVRGLREREATGDTGWSLSLEAAAPLPWAGLRGVLFADAGEVRVKDAAAGQAARQVAASLGAGLRWAVERRVSLALDGAYVVDGAATTRSGERRLHASLTYQF